MKQTIEIEVPDGKKAVWKDGKVVFEDIKPQLPKTWKEFCKNYLTGKAEYYINSACSVCEARSGTKRQEVFDRNILPSREAGKAHLALMQLHQLRDCYRQDWKPDWGDSSYKYGIKWDMIDGEIKLAIAQHHTYDSDFLLFPTYELAEEFLTNFRDLIEEAGDLI